MSKLISDWSTFHSDIVNHFSGDSPLFLSRIGGSDTNALVDYLRAKNVGPSAVDAHVKVHLPIVERYNGFYELSADTHTSYFRYLQVLFRCYISMRMATFVHTYFMSRYFPERIDQAFFTADVPNRSTMEELVERIVSSNDFLGAYPYSFVESMVKNPHALFQAFTKILHDKTVLVLSPFSESIHANFGNRREFFKNDYVYPDFKLTTITTPITYSGMEASFYPHRNWFETVAALTEQIRNAEFDIALMACGSYAMPLGLFIEQELKKNAIYVGGVLQLFFGVMGRRYENPFFLDQINREHFIQPIEREKFLSLIPTSDSAAREAFGAYF